MKRCMDMQLFYKVFIKFSFYIICLVLVMGCATSTTASEKTTGEKPIDPDDPMSPIYLNTKGRPAGKGDAGKPVGEAYKMGAGWHPQALQAAGLPHDKYGLVDWARLVKEGLIKPKASTDPKIEEIPPLDMDNIMDAQGNVDDALFSHGIHTYWLSCEACHPKIYVPAKGQNRASMASMAQGLSCGKCHGKVAFPLADCSRCHVKPKKAR
jgi:c(7)-type cytochrome triheme protein